MAGEAKPRIDVRWDVVDRALNVMGALGLVALLAGSVWAWRHLPAVIPIHFGFSGQADGWGDRGFVLVLPIPGLALYGLLTLLVRVPHLYNYPWPITAQNAARQYLLARRLILALRVLFVLVFLELLAGTTSVALGRSLSLGPWSMPALLSCLGLILISYVAAARRAR